MAVEFTYTDAQRLAILFGIELTPVCQETAVDINQFCNGMRWELENQLEEESAGLVPTAETVLERLRRDPNYYVFARQVDEQTELAHEQVRRSNRRGNRLVPALRNRILYRRRSQTNNAER